MKNYVFKFYSSTYKTREGFRYNYKFVLVTYVRKRCKK